MSIYKNSKVVNRSLQRTFKKLIDDWLDVIEEYSRENPGDGLYCYNERATLSSLVGVIWKREEYALEEYSAYKGKGKKEYLGRADLWFSTKTETNYYIEAKQEWPLISERAAVFPKKIEISLTEAVNDVKKIKDQGMDANDRFLGVVFAVPYLPSYDCSEDVMPLRIERFIKKIEAIKCDFYGYYFDTASEVYDKRNDLLPGIAILGQLT